MDHFPRPAGIPDLGLVLDRVVADRDHHVGLVEQPVAGLVFEKPHAPDKIGKEIPGHNSRPLVGGDARQAVPPDQLADRPHILLGAGFFA